MAVFNSSGILNRNLKSLVFNTIVSTHCITDRLRMACVYLPAYIRLITFSVSMTALISDTSFKVKSASGYSDWD